MDRSPEAGSSTMQCDLFERLILDGSSSKTCQDSTQAMVGETLQLWLVKSLGPNLTFRGRDGRTPVLSPGREGWSKSAFYALSGSAWRSGASVCSLSQILERGPIDRRYFLSPKACRGILRRAWRRGRDLPPGLLAALAAKAFGSSLPALFASAERLGRLRSREPSALPMERPVRTPLMPKADD